MQFSGMLRYLLEVAREAANFVPHPRIRIERQAANGNPVDEITGRGKKAFDKDAVFGKKQNIAHQETDGFNRLQLINTVFRTLLQKKEGRDGRGTIFSGPGQLSGEG